MRLSLLCLSLCAPPASAAFGNLDVSWQSEGKADAKAPKVTLDRPLAQFKPSSELRHSNLEGLQPRELASILEAMGGECAACGSVAAWASKVRHAVLELPNKRLKAELKRRGVKCEGCTQREQYVDLLLDCVHLPQVNADGYIFVGRTTG
ncbi:hypothetical protein AB1Y20_016265 [Prymnesium parvum]|uniref:Uncharacterized protein n=1 Tax=Prymnesium parvum TaxID=97485 RepID=A0AB34IEA3_PRYPA